MPLLFLDFDDVLCLNRPYGGYDVLLPPEQQPTDLFERLWHAPSAETLRSILSEHTPRVVLTTSWTRFLDRPAFEVLFRATGLPALADGLHEAWAALQNTGETRCAAIERWLAVHHRGEPFVVLDDSLSGTGLAGSALETGGHVILCGVGKGLGPAHLALARHALSLP